MAKLCKKCIVTGRVQGVFFRASAREKALDNGLCGWARNLGDGTVEVMLCGESQEVELVSEWLWQGPPYADVEKVSCEELEYQALSGFETS